MKKIREDIQNRSFSRIYLLYGEETDLRNEAARLLLSAVAGSDTMNLRRIDGPADFETLPGLLDFVITVPFMSDYRVLLWDRSQLFRLRKTEKTDGETEEKKEEKAEDDGEDRILSLLRSVPETAVVIFTEDEVDKRSKYYKYIQKNGYISEFRHPDKEDIGKWILKKLKAENLKIRQDTYCHLLSKLPDDFSELKNETEKLLSYCIGKEVVETSDVDALLSDNPEDRVFDMIEAAISGKKEKAYQLYQDLLILQQSPIFIFKLMERETAQLYEIKKMKAMGKSDGEIYGALSMNEWLYKKLFSAGRKISAEKAKSLFYHAVDIETQLKNGNLQDKLLPELLLAEILNQS